jgi:hypothetical protein
VRSIEMSAPCGESLTSAKVRNYRTVGLAAQVATVRATDRLVVQGRPVFELAYLLVKAGSRSPGAPIVTWHFALQRESLPFLSRSVRQRRKKSPPGMRANMRGTKECRQTLRCPDFEVSHCPPATDHRMCSWIATLDFSQRHGTCRSPAQTVRLRKPNHVSI